MHAAAWAADWRLPRLLAGVLNLYPCPPAPLSHRYRHHLPYSHMQRRKAARRAQHDHQGLDFRLWWQLPR